MKSVWLSFAFAFLLTSAAHAQTVERIIFHDPGLYRFEVEKVDKTPDSVSTGFKTIKNFELIRRTEQVPGILGTAFGFRFDIVGYPNSAPITLRLVTRFPSPGVRNPATGKVLLESVNDRPYFIGEMSSRSYTFDEEWEIVPGIWSLEFWYDGKMVGAQKFEVVKADLPPMSERLQMPSADTPGER